MLPKDVFRKPMTTDLTWNELDVPKDTLSQIHQIEKWANSRKLSLAPRSKIKIKPGYRALFSGPSGTGKTLTAALLAKGLERDVYRIDLSMVASKYIGETEKNLSAVFNRAEDKEWILFFDEADALFGKRTSARDAHDKYANQEVSFLMKQIERYEGLVIVSSNSESYLEDPYIRLFDVVIRFP